MYPSCSAAGFVTVRGLGPYYSIYDRCPHHALRCSPGASRGTPRERPRNNLRRLGSSPTNVYSHLCYRCLLLVNEWCTSPACHLFLFGIVYST